MELVSLKFFFLVIMIIVIEWYVDNSKYMIYDEYRRIE